MCFHTSIFLIIYLVFDYYNLQCFEASSVEIDDEEDNGEGIKRLDEDEDIDVNSDTDNNSQV